MTFINGHCHRPGRIPLFFAKRARRDGLAYHLSRIGGVKNLGHLGDFRLIYIGHLGDQKSWFP
jgi:hypothetical protein